MVADMAVDKVANNVKKKKCSKGLKDSKNEVCWAKAIWSEVYRTCVPSKLFMGKIPTFSPFF